MANRRNAIKKIRADEKKRVNNKRVLSNIRTQARKFQVACEAKEAEKARELCRQFFSKLDKAVKRGLVKEKGDASGY